MKLLACILFLCFAVLCHWAEVKNKIWRGDVLMRRMQGFFAACALWIWFV